MTVLILFLWIGFFILELFVANEFHQIAIKKGYYDRKYFWWSFLLGIVGYLMVVALPDKSTKLNSQSKYCRNCNITYVQAFCPICGCKHE